MSNLLRLSLFVLPFAFSSVAHADPPENLRENILREYLHLDPNAGSLQTGDKALTRARLLERISTARKVGVNVEKVIKDGDFDTALEIIHNLNEELKSLEIRVNTDTNRRSENLRGLIAKASDNGKVALGLRGGDLSVSGNQGPQGNTAAKEIPGTTQQYMGEKAAGAGQLEPKVNAAPNAAALGLLKKTDAEDPLEIFRKNRALISSIEGYQESPMAAFARAHKGEIIRSAHEMELLSNAKASLKKLISHGLSQRSAHELFRTFAGAMGINANQFKDKNIKVLRAFFETAPEFLESYGAPQKEEEEREEGDTAPTPKVDLRSITNNPEDPLGNLPDMARLLQTSSSEKTVDESLASKVTTLIAHGGTRDAHDFARGCQIVCVSSQI